jgi:hypothetical protein
MSAKYTPFPNMYPETGASGGAIRNPARLPRKTLVHTLMFRPSLVIFSLVEHWNDQTRINTHKSNRHQYNNLVKHSMENENYIVSSFYLDHKPSTPTQGHNSKNAFVKKSVSKDGSVVTCVI